jgi:hypothetical protein
VLSKIWYLNGAGLAEMLLPIIFFTSVELVEQLLADGLTYTGTIRSNKAHIPPEMKPNSNRT